MSEQINHDTSVILNNVKRKRLRNYENEAWITVDLSDAGTFPPPFKRCEIEAMPKTIYPASAIYTHGFGFRSGVADFAVSMPDKTYRAIDIRHIVKWRKA